MERRLRPSSPPSDLNEDDQKLWRTLYEHSLAQGAPESIARQATDEALLELPKEVRRFADMYDQYERLIESKEPETLSLKWQLFMWNYKDPDASLRESEMWQSGMTAEEITMQVFPLRWDLIRRGRRRVKTYIAYANRMASIAAVVAEAKSMPASGMPHVPIDEVGPGRRKGSGTFRTPREFRSAIAAAIRGLETQGKRPTQANVAEFLTQSPDPEHPQTDGRQLRRWFKDQFGYPTWEELLDDVMR